MPSYLMTAKCPRCGRVHRIPTGAVDVECDCHLYCSSGDRPQDCSVSVYNYSGGLNWPMGSHQDSDDEGDDVLHRVRYCSTHEKYIYKTAIILEADYTQLTGNSRLKKRHRLLWSR